MRADTEPGAAAGPFGGRVRWLVGVALVSLVASAALGIFADVFEVPSHGADAFSRSAIGHHAFVELVRALGRDVVVSRARTAERGAGAVVILAEPLVGPAGLDERSREVIRDVLARARGVLLVLPKRMGYPDQLRPSWLGGATLAPSAIAEVVLEAAGLEGAVIRPAKGGGWEGALPHPTLTDPQLVTSTGLTSLLRADAGLLVGERARPGARLIVLADPDVLATHGLGRGENAQLVAALLARLDPGGAAAVVVDETLHGHELQPSLARELLRWPLALATLQAAIALALLAWAALVRFGRARPAPQGLTPGKAFLVENTAELLRQGRHLAPAVASYWHAAKEEIVRALRPPGERRADLDRSVARLAAARGREAQLAELERRLAQLSAHRPTEHEVLRAALDIHAFREVMTHGARSHP